MPHQQQIPQLHRLWALRLKLPLALYCFLEQLDNKEPSYKCQRLHPYYQPLWHLGHPMLQSTQFFVLLPTPSNLSTHRTSRTNHTDPSERIPISNTSINASQSTHAHATHYL